MKRVLALSLAGILAAGAVPAEAAGMLRQTPAPRIVGHLPIAFPLHAGAASSGGFVPAAFHAPATAILPAGFIVPVAAAPQPAVLETALASAKTAAGAEQDLGAPSPDGAAVFDGTRETPQTDAPGLSRLAARFVANGPAGRLLPARWAARINAPVEPKIPTRDALGGPLHEKLGYKGQIVKGLKEGLRMTGLTTLITVAATGVSSLVQWQIQWPDIAALFGRVELLVRVSPAQLAEGVAKDPVGLVFHTLPLNVLLEEIAFRGVAFGGLVGALWWIGGCGEALGRLFERAGLDRTMQILPKLLRAVARFAFPVAALASATAFALAHLAPFGGAWSFNPGTLAVPLVLGISLARLAYQTRSPIPPLTAHLSYNLLLVGGLAAAVWFPALAVPYAAVLAAGSVGYLLWPKLRGLFLANTWRLRPLAKFAGKAVSWSLAVALAFGVMAGSEAPTTGTLTAGRAPIIPIELVEATVPAKKLTTEEIVKAVSPAVIQVMVKTATGAGTGSGFIVTKEGIAITNHHVVGPVGIGGQVMVRFSDDKEVPALVLAMDKHRDIAIIMLKPRAEEYPTVRIASDEKMKKLVVGAAVVAMGSPMGINQSTSKGIISGLGGGRREGFQIQHDAAVNPGNSGGPLFDEEGEVIGINTAILSWSGAFAGISLTRSSDVLRAAIAQYQKTGSISPAWLGVIVDRSAPAENLPGFVIELVKPGSSAHKGGLMAGDRVTAVDGRPLPANARHSLAGMAQLLAGKKLGDKITLTILRDGERMAVQVTLGEWLQSAS